MLSEQITRETLIDRRLAVVTTAIASIYGISLVSVALLPLLAREVPHLLILLNPATGVLLVVSARVGLIPFLALAVLRRVLLHILFFLLGEWYGESAVRWVEGRSGRTSQFVTYVERAFARLSWPVILLAAGPLPSVLAGAGGCGAHISSRSTSPERCSACWSPATPPTLPPIHSGRHCASVTGTQACSPPFASPRPAPGC